MKFEKKLYIIWGCKDLVWQHDIPKNKRVSSDEQLFSPPQACLAFDQLVLGMRPE